MPVPQYTPEFKALVYTVSDEVDKLATLGSPRQIALFLERRKITGRLGDGAICPLYNYLVPVINPKRNAFHVSRHALRLYSTNVKNLARVFVMPHPLVVVDFINEFDQKRYPALIR
jgi:hypothetical protein